ncbi:MAG: HEAT repeat domain-containing protein [Candidatus Zhuqueibacterota bacterium]
MKKPGYTEIFFFIAMIIGIKAHSCLTAEVIYFIHQPQMALEQRIQSALHLAMKKFDGREIWLAYSLDSNAVQSLDAQTSHQERMEQQPLTQLLMQDAAGLPALLVLDYSLESGYPYLHHAYIFPENDRGTEEIRPTIWLGVRSAKQSLDWLQKQFYISKSPTLSKQLVHCIGMHGCEEAVIEFNRAVLFSQFSEPIKSEALAGLSLQEAPASIRTIVSVFSMNNAPNLKKRAIAELSQMQDERAHRYIFSIASSGKDVRLRKEAIFWLAQIGSDQAIQVLLQIFSSELDPAMKEYTIFSIGQLPQGRGHEILCQIAETNSDERMREKARFWMGQSSAQRFNVLLKEMSDEQSVK